MKSILCAECNEQITKRNDLIVAGKLMKPYHKSCLEKPNSTLGKTHKFMGKFPVGIYFWILIILGNFFIGEMLRKNPDSPEVLIFFGIIFNLVFIGGRIGIYYSYEQYIE
ncbi:MAG: hypothetical protein D6B25_08885 [Desulfobulbaceae bacterium]|nr:MAG: hypothetical protein D6B25_08885 [Desulfobulbaceae bacterium]